MAAANNPNTSKFWSNLKNFGVGGLSGCIATSFVQPIDMVKVRIQLNAESGGATSPFTVAKDLYKNEGGLKGLYRGYDSAIMRQCVYTTTRLGIFYSLVDNIKEKQGGKNLSAFQKAYCSLTAGGIGSLVGTPADLILVRMQSDTTLPVEQRRNYKSVFDAGRRIISEEGFLKMFTGCSPTVIRAMVLNLGMLTTYEEAKERLAKAMPNNKTLSWVMASFMSGAVASTMTLPFDNAKTKVQKQVPGADGKLPYKNMFDCMQKTAAKEGVGSLWAGLPTFIFRIAPHVMITLIASENIKALLA